MRGAAAESSPSPPRAKIPLSDGKCIRTFSATEGTLFFRPYPAPSAPDGFGVTDQRAALRALFLVASSGPTASKVYKMICRR